jgi:hypothetical protein
MSFSVISQTSPFHKYADTPGDRGFAPSFLMLFELPKPDYGFQSGEVVGVMSAYNLPNLKQNLLLFDKFLLVHKRGDSMAPGTASEQSGY